MEYFSFRQRNLDFMCPSLPKTYSEFSNSRSTAAVTLRKEKRQKHLMHKRLNTLKNSPGSSVSLEKVINNLSYTDLSSIKALRKLLCEDKFDKLHLLELRPDIVNYLSKGLISSKTELIYEISWCFANLAIGPPMIVNDVCNFKFFFADAIIHLDNKSLAEQACWVLGNLAADHINTKNSIVQIPGLIKSLVHLLTLRNNSLNSVACWTMCNLIRGPNPDTFIFFEAGALLPVLEITHKPYSCQVIESLWLLSFFTCKANNEIFALIYDQQNIQTYLKYLESNDPKLLVPIIRILGNGFLMYPYLDYLFITNEFSEILIKLINNQNPQVRKESLWMLSNIFSLEYSEPAMVYIGEKVIKSLISLINDEIQEIKNEAGIALYNLAEVYESRYLQSISFCTTLNVFEYYVSNILNVPAWIKLKIQGIYDIDLLKVSLGFLLLYFQQNDKKKEIEEYLYSDDVKDAIEECQITIEKGKNNSSSSEDFIIQICIDLLKWYNTDKYNFS